MVAQDEMTDSEIIQLLQEYNFTNKEISGLLGEIKQRDFESVLAFVEEACKSSGKWGDDDKQKMQAELSKRNDQQKIEDDLKERYKARLMEKIAANREEQRLREEKENENIEIAEAPVTVEGDVKVRILLVDDDEMYIGFDINATVKDLYDKVAEQLGRTAFELSIFGIGTTVPMSERLIVDEFQAKSIMLELN